MKFKRSFLYVLFVYSLPFFLFGILAFTDPASVQGGITEKQGFLLLIGSIVTMLVSFLLFTLAKSVYSHFNPQGIISISAFSGGLRKYLIYGLILSIFTSFFVLIEKNIEIKSEMLKFIFAIIMMALIFTWMIWAVLCVSKFINLIQSKKLIKTGKEYLSDFSFINSAENQFNFPTKYFDSGEYGVAEYRFEKSISGILLGLFQYAQMQKRDKKIHVIRYVVIQITTNKQLPKFNFSRVCDAQEATFLGLSINNPSASGINKEMDGSSNIEFTVKDGDLYRLSIEKKLEIEALQIFSDNLVEKIASNWSNIILLGEGNDLIAIAEKTIQTRADFETFDSLTNFLVNEIIPRIDLVGKSVEAMRDVMSDKNRL